MIKQITSIAYKPMKKEQALAQVVVGGLSSSRNVETVADVTKSIDFKEAMEKAAEVLKQRERCPRSSSVELRKINRVEMAADEGESFFIYKLSGKLILPDCNPSIKTGDLFSANYFDVVNEPDTNIVPLDDEDTALIEEAFEQADKFVKGERGFLED